MDYTHILSQHRVFKNALIAYQKIRQTLDFVLLQKQKKFLKSTWFLWMMAFVVGLIAYQNTKNSHYNDWLKTHTPHYLSWSAALAPWGYRLDSHVDSEFLSKVSPKLSPQSPRVWQSIDQTALLVFSSAEVWLFKNELCNLSLLNPIDWEPLGWGWDAIHAISLKPLPTLVKNKIKPRQTKDPKELSY